jgi:antitoxin (DNA-binding transcriptional repressor) of toxin-antitoxin stability system
MLSDMKTLTMRDLNRHTASVVDALERGESFEVRRNGRAVGYLTQTAPAPERKPDWKAHFDWLRRQPTKNDAKVLKEFEDSRRRLAVREKAMGNLL